MASRDRLRPLKAWRYVGIFGPELMVCAAAVRVGPARQSFWAVWDRRRGILLERTRLGGGGVRLSAGRVLVQDGETEIDLRLEEEAGIETVCPSGASYAWTRKQGGILAAGHLYLRGARYEIQARAIVDDTAAYYQRHTDWLWSAGIGTAADGRPVTWNLVAGVNDPPRDSERTVWVDGIAYEPPPCRFEPDLSGVGALRFSAEAVRRRRENRLLLRSDYRQPFGTFSGELPGGPALAEGYGVMEAHHAVW